MKYAVIEHGGKQYVAREGESLELDRMVAEIGKTIEFKDVLLFVDGRTVKVGSPLVKGGKVKGKVSAQFKDKKVVVFKFRPKQRYRRKKGHRQPYTRIEIDTISLAKPRTTAQKDEAKPKADKPATAKKTTTTRSPSTAKKTSSTKAAPKKTTTRKSSTTKSKSTTGSAKTKKPSTGSSRSSSSRKQQDK